MSKRTLVVAGALGLAFVTAACGSSTSGGASSSSAAAASPSASGSASSSSSVPSEVRDYPYCEVIPDTVSGSTVTEHIFNTLPYGPCPPQKFPSTTEADITAAYNAAFGANSTTATVNGPRHWVLDSITSQGGITSSQDSMTVNGLKYGLVGELQTPVGQPTIGTDPYVVNTVQRDTVYVFKKGGLVYELTDPSGNVYIMQSYSQQVDTSLTLEKLSDIGSTDQLPTGWKYAARRLNEDLTLTAAGSTSIVNDYYRNTFQINPAAKG
ncbi:MAG: hypothetical protein WCP26_08400 [Actinomycetes bacterium]